MMLVLNIRTWSSANTNYSLLYLIILYFTSHLALSQNTTIDSLEHLLDQRPSLNQRADIYNELAYEQYVYNLDISLAYADSSIVLSKQTGSKKLLSTAYNRAADVKIDRGEFNHATAYLDSALRLEEEINDLNGLARAYSKLASVHKNQANWYEALTFGRKAVNTYEQTGNLRDYATSMNMLANIFYDRTTYDSSAYYHNRSLEIRQQLNGTSDVAQSLLNLGRLYWKTNDPERSLEYSRKSLSIYESLGYQASIAIVLTNIGNALFDLERFDEAEELYLRGLKIRGSNPRLQKLTPLNYNSLGNLAIARKNWNEAKRYHQLAYEIRLNEDDQLTYLSELNLGTVARFTKDYALALDFYEKAYQRIQDLEILEQRPEILLYLSTTLNSLDRHDEASDFLSQYNDLRDKILYKASRAVNLERELDNEKSVRLLQAAEMEKQRATIYWLITGGALIVLLFFTIFRISQLRNRNLLNKKEASLQKERIKQLIKEKEIDAMNAMVEGQESERLRIARDLHDRLGGTLSIVKMHFKSVEDSIEALKETSVKQYKEANHLLDEACEEVRKIAHDMSSGVLMKFGLTAALEDLKATVEATGQLKMNLIEIGLDERLDYEHEINIYRMIQELLTNTLKHARAKEMNIQLFRKEKDLSIVVEDDGVGFEPEIIKAEAGMGLKNIENRVQKFDGEMSIDSGKGAGTTVTIDLPIKPKKI